MVSAAIDLCLGLPIGAGCRWFDIPSPAPPVVVGALPAMAMTIGYVLVDRYAAMHPMHRQGTGGRGS
jgi:XapX domain-containing protein